MRDPDIEPTMSEATARRQDGLIDAMLARGVQCDTTSPFDWHNFVDTLKRN
jgi:hypothetical protein